MEPQTDHRLLSTHEQLPCSACGGFLPRCLFSFPFLSFPFLLTLGHSVPGILALPWTDLRSL